VGERIKLSYTRAMITAALRGELENVAFIKHPIFGMEMPVHCPGVPSNLLNPGNTWADQAQYNAKAQSLAKEFILNFEKYADQVSPEILAAGPKL
ncbi:MAG TPA: phosphoenolpyruvate carboxykinase (ATP), partial [Saprospirales bacterium]|nr:phosphoenolpyruvate carboxykinase (ATP) [Saprospirales bacterium]